MSWDKCEAHNTAKALIIELGLRTSNAAFILVLLRFLYSAGRYKWESYF